LEIQPFAKKLALTNISGALCMGLENDVSALSTNTDTC